VRPPSSAPMAYSLACQGSISRGPTRFMVRCCQIEELTKGRHLIVVPSGVFTQLPFQVLVTEAPDPALSGADAFRRGHIRAPSAVPRGRYVGDPGVPFLRPGR